VIICDHDALGVPAWVSEFSPERLRCCLSTPTLEPALVADNPELVQAAIRQLGGEAEAVTAESVAAYFGTGGAGNGKKAAFAEAVVDLINAGTIAVGVPSHIAEALDFLWEGANDPHLPADGAHLEAEGDPTQAH
jgi:hypothetical protein